jgi:hypothetical protein
VRRDRFSGHYRLHADYFCDNPVFWMICFVDGSYSSIYCIVIVIAIITIIPNFVSNMQVLNVKSNVFDICHTVATRKQYFQRRVNVDGVSTFTTLQKITVIVHMLIYRGHVDRLDEYICMGESTIL